MKNVKFFMASLCVAVLALSCEKAVEFDQPNNEVSPQLTTITCAFPTMTDQNGTKVTLDAAGHTGWEAGDKIVIYGKRNHENNTETPLSPVIHTLTAAEVADPKVAVFTEDLSGLEPDPDGLLPYNAAYPADDWGFYSMWYSSARARFSETNQLLLAGGMSAGGEITFNNLCGAIMFKVSGDFDEYRLSGNNDETVGYDDYLVEVNVSSPNYLKKPGESYGTIGPKTVVSGPVVGDGSTINYIYIPNEVNFTSGFTIRFYKAGAYTHYITTNSSFSLSHGHCVNLGLLPSGAVHEYVAPTNHNATHPAITGATDLGASGTANCYIVDASVAGNAGKVFKFKAYKGNSTTGVGEIASVSILWESYNNDQDVTANSVILEADFDKQDANDYYEICFKMPTTLHAGNALIAAKNGSDEIVWSWHIWVPATTISRDDYGISSVDIMSRNLGALVDTDASETTVDARSFGLIYQWGRKDPFLGSKRFNSSSQALNSGTAKSETTSQYTIAQSIANPTTYVAYKGDWMTPESTTLWTEGGDKSIYDPCPPGYRVPARNSSDPLWSKVVTLDPSYGWEPNSTYGWWKLGTAVFPFAGYIDYSGGSVAHAYDRARIWNAHKSTTGYAYDQQIWYDAEWKSEPEWQHRTACGNSVRCAVDE
ncbi:MAG: hypothetical protein IJK44_01285 [Bacteroidales bacterium]|nr:hypothetical protein [Bacteroidales bacterium]